ncbi:MAG: MCE family protein, partial [Aeromicrobium sp.]
GILLVNKSLGTVNKTRITAYFANTNGLFIGDEVRILGVPVGLIDTIEPQPQRAKVTFYVDEKYKVPADVNAVIVSPSLVPVRAIQLTPVYRDGPTLADNSVIPEDRTAVPVEFDDFREQLERLADALQPTQPNGTSTLGAFINTAADNLRGEGPNIRDTVIKLSQAFSALGDNSANLFTTLKNLSILVSALEDSRDLLRQLNGDLASVTGVLANDSNEIGNAFTGINDVVGDLNEFLADNRETLGTTSDKLASVTQFLSDNLYQVKEILHTSPNSFQNFLNIYQPAQGALTGALGINQLSNPIQFLCGAIQAASRMGAEQSAKLCVQYLAPIIKNRIFNFPPIGENLFVGTQARPNEITYSEDWLRPDYIPPQAGDEGTPHAPLPPAGGIYTRFGEPAANPPGNPPFVPVAPGTPPEEMDHSNLPPAQPTNPSDGLQGMMVPPGGGS